MAETKETPEKGTPEEKEEVIEFEPGAPHPDTPQSVLEEQGIEISDYKEEDDALADQTWERLQERQKKKNERKTLRIPDPEDLENTLVFTYRQILPGDSMLLNDVAIITALFYNMEHERPNDTLQKAVAENRVAEFLQVAQNNWDHQSHIISRGLEITVEEVEETITHPKVRRALVDAIQVKGGAVPKLSTDKPTDTDIFPSETTEQESGQETQET